MCLSAISEIPSQFSRLSGLLGDYYAGLLDEQFK